MSKYKDLASKDASQRGDLVNIDVSKINEQLAQSEQVRKNAEAQVCRSFADALKFASGGK